MNDALFDIATAPGDLPLRDVVARDTSLSRQFRHDNSIEPLGPKAGQPITVSATSGLHVPLARAEVWLTTDGSLPEDGAERIVMNPMSDWRFNPGYLTRWIGVIPGQPVGTIVRYRIAGWLAGAAPDAPPDIFAMDGSGFWFRSEPTDAITVFAFPIEPAEPVHPEWLQEAVIYHIFLDRYHPGNSDGCFPANADPQAKHGGTLCGVMQTLPYLKELGVSCLWLSPIGPSDSYHRYDANDYFAVDPPLGTVDDLRALTTAAHAHGMRVLLDFVPSHLSADHEAFVAAQTQPNALTRDWFTFYEWPHRYRSFLDMVPWLVSINTNSAGARQHIIDSALYWMREAGIDGYRLDHAIGHGMDFWTQFRAALIDENPAVVTIGEVTDTADCLRAYRGRLHDVLDFPLARALRLVFATGDWSVADLHTYLDSYDRYMADGPGRVSFLDNHDMDRFLYVAGNDPARLKLAALCQFSLEQPPVIYYGTEIGLVQARGMDEVGLGGDVEVRQDMIWDPAGWDWDLLEFYRALVAGRGMHAALRGNRRELVWLDAAGGTYAFRRSAAGAPDVVVAFNVGPALRTVPLVAGDLLLSTAAGVSLTDEGLVLPPLSGAWLAE